MSKDDHLRKFTCEDCRNLNPFDFRKMIRHLEKKHGVSWPQSIFRSGRTRMFLDGDRELRYVNEFVWWVSDIKLTEVSTGPAA